MMFYSKDCCESANLTSFLLLRQTAQYTALRIIWAFQVDMYFAGCLLSISILSNDNENIDKIDSNGDSYLAPPPL